MPLGNGCGTGLGLGGSLPSIAAFLSQIHGASLHWLVDSAGIVTDANNNITSWVGTIGPSLSNANSNRCKSTTVNGRKAAASNTDGASLISNDSLGTASFWFVARCSASVTQYETPMISYGISDPQFVRDSTYNQWIISPYSIAHYLDGAVDATIPTSGVHIFETIWTDATLTNGVMLLGHRTLSRPFLGEMLCAFRLSSKPTSEQRANTVAGLRSFHGQ